MDAGSKTPQEMLFHWEQTVPERVYLRQPVNRAWCEFTWEDVGNQARRMTAALRELGLQPGDRVGIFSKNCAEWVIADFAIMLGGFVSVPVYSSANADTLGYVLTHSDCRAVFVGKLDSLKGLARAIPEDCVSIAFPYDTLRTNLRWNDVLEEHELPADDVVVPAMDDVMTILYTSGSTGNPKGAVHTYGSFAFVGSSIATEWKLGPEDRMLSFLPMAHCTDRAYVEASSIYASSQVSFTESLATFFADLSDVRPTLFGTVPRLWKRFQLMLLENLPQEQLENMLADPNSADAVKRKIAADMGLDQATWFASGAAPIAPALLEWWERIGIPICEGWGMTETFAYGTQCTPGMPMRLGSIGKALPEVDLQLSDTGELLIKTPSMMREYYREPELTAAEFTEDGYFRTGDRAEIDADGYVKITGRAKEIFKTAKGKYVAPVPIESLFAQNEIVEQICIVGLGLVQPVALIQLAEGVSMDQKLIGTSLEGTRLEVNATLESHARVSRIVIVNEAWTPENGMLTPTLKIKRHVVEAKFKSWTSQESGPSVIFV